MCIFTWLKSVGLFRELRQLIVSHRRDTAMPIKTLSLKLSGIVDAAVMGGSKNYEKVIKLVKLPLIT